MNVDPDFDIDSEEDTFPEELLHSPLEGIADSVIQDIVSRQVWIPHCWVSDSCWFITLKHASFTQIGCYCK